MTSKELNEILNKTRRLPFIALTPEQVEELINDLEVLEILKNHYSGYEDEFGTYLLFFSFPNKEVLNQIRRELNGKD